MAISRTQPMRPAEIDLLDHMESAEGNIEQLQEDLEETNGVVEELNRELDQEIVNRQLADTALGTRIDNETQTRARADTTLGNRLDTAEDDIRTLQNDFASIPVFEYGVSKNNAVPAASSIGVDITFADAKESTPYVFISVECAEVEESPVSNCYGIIISASTTGFSVRLHNIDSVNAETININWLAIGE